MFKKLKDKIAEEVKQSPLKSVQQLAQAVVSPTSSSVFEPSSSNDKFCIEEGDIEEDEKSSTKSPTGGGGFTSVSLTGQISSPARRHGPRTVTTDIENLFPVFESQPTNFHVQSDWESASEVEDRGQLEHISKENLYDAYRKVYGRYNKMKNKYQELVTYYRHLEREKDKAKNVLTETQDKALLRISELREQCLLEQQAKAHLEEALRNELEEKDHIINSLKTKVQYLKSINEGALPEKVDIDQLPGQEMDNLIDFTENSCVSKVPLPSIASSNLESLEWLHQQLTNCNKFLVDKTTNIEHLKSQLEELKKKNVNMTSSLETENSISDQLHAFQNQSQEESQLFQSLVNIANEFSKETKLLHSKMKTFLFKEDKEKLVNINSIMTGSFDASFEDKLSVSTSAGGDGAQMVLSRCEENESRDHNLHSDELKKLYQTISDLQVLNKKLMEEKEGAEQLQSNLSLLNETLDLIKTKLQYTNQLVEQGHFNINDINLSQEVENDIIKDLNLFITTFIHTKSEIGTLKSLVVNLENELKTTKDEVDHLKTKDKNTAICLENQNGNLSKLNDELKEQLERLQTENNNRLACQESLQIELTNMKSLNEKLEVQIQETNTLVQSSEQLGLNKKKEFNQITMRLEEEKKALQNEINRLNEELDVTKTNVSSLIDLKDSLSNEILTLKKENNDLLMEKENLKVYLEELKSLIEQDKQEYSAIKALNTSLTDELTMLKEEHINTAAEKKILLENIKKLETTANHLTDALALSKKKFEDLQEEQLSSMKNNDDTIKEKDILQGTILELESEVDKLKMECSRIKEDKVILNEELSSLRKECNSIAAEKCDLNEQINTVCFDLESKIKDYNAVLEENKTLSVEILNLRNDHDLIIADKNVLQLRFEDLDKELKINKGKLDDSLIVNKQLSVEISSCNEDINKLNNEKKELQTKIEALENIKSKSNDYVEETNILKQKVEGLEKELEVLKQDYEKSVNILTNDITVLKRNNEELEKERKSLQIIIKDLNTNIEIEESKYLSAEESNKKLLDELRLSKIEQNDLIVEKENLLKELKSLKEEVENNQNELSLLVKERDGYCGEIAVLKQEINSISIRENGLLKDLDKLVKERENDHVNYESLQQEKKKLSDELVMTKKEFEEVGFVLNETKEQLTFQQDTCNKLNKQIKELSESYKNKCNDIHHHHQQECAQLRMDTENMTKQFNEMNSSLKSITNERNNLLNSFIVNLNTVKIVRQIQTELFNFVEKLKKEIAGELNEIKLKISRDLMFHVGGVLKTHEDHDRQIYELQCKSKKEIDLYNSKIKSLQAQIQNTDKVTNSNLFAENKANLQNQEEGLYSVIPTEKNCDLEKNMSELSNCILIYKNRCSQLELSLNHALLIMSSIHSILTESSESADSLGFRTVREEEIAAIKLFIDEHKNNDLDTKYSINKFNLDSEDNINNDSTPGFNVDVNTDSKLATAQHSNQPLAIKAKEVIEKEFAQNINSFKLGNQVDNTSLEIQQLKQEIKLKEDIIKKLQFVIEEFEQEKEIFSPKITQGNSKEYVNIKSYSPTVEVGDRNGSSMNNEEHITWLEQQNKILNEKLETMKQFYESNIKRLTSDYENKLDYEEGKKINEIQQSGKEKKFILNEMKELIENLQHDLDQRGDAYEKLYEEHQLTLKARDEAVRQLRINYEKEMREQDKKWRSCLDRKMAEEDLRHKDEIKMLSQEWATQRKELEMASQLAVSVVESGSNSSDLLRRQVQSLTLQISQLQNERCKCQQRQKSPILYRNIPDGTEMEYLRNILYDYMMGKEPVVLAKVLCALMKFNENQTNNIVSKEEQRLTLFGQLGIL